MKKVVLFLVGSLLFSMSAMARDTIGDYSVEEAMILESFKEKLGSDIKFYFGTQKHGKATKTFGEFSTSKKTNAFGKSDRQACEWAFLSAMLSLRDRAVREGGNAVVNIKSNYRNNETISNDTFQCGAGAFVAGVALKGTVVKIGK